MLALSCLLTRGGPAQSNRDIITMCCNKPKSSRYRWDRRVLEAHIASRVSEATRTTTAYLSHAFSNSNFLHMETPAVVVISNLKIHFQPKLLAWALRGTNPVKCVYDDIIFGWPRNSVPEMRFTPFLTLVLSQVCAEIPLG